MNKILELKKKLRKHFKESNTKINESCFNETFKYLNRAFDGIKIEQEDINFMETILMITFESHERLLK